jgi:hypothetical protein
MIGMVFPFEIVYLPYAEPTGAVNGMKIYEFIKIKRLKAMANPPEAEKDGRCASFLVGAAHGCTPPSSELARLDLDHFTKPSVR